MMAKTNHNSKLSPFDSKESNPFAQTSASESKPSPSAPELSPSAGQGNNPIKEPGKHDFILPNPDLDPIGVHWPRQSLFVGSNHVVQWNGGGGGFAANSESVSEADLDVALGRNPIESFATVLAGEIPNLSGNERSQVEQLLTAFGLGVYSETTQPNGDVALETAVHRESFDSIQGGEISDWRKDSEKQDPPVSIQNNQTEEEKEKEGLKELSFAAPNFYQSSDISVMITNSHRSTRHGEDGIHDEHGLLQCRMSDVAFNVLSNDPSTKPVFPNHGAIPVECEKLSQELSYHASVLNNTKTREEFSNIKKLVSGEHLDQKVSLNIDDFYTIFMNHIRSPVAINVWNQAWIPLFVECSFELAELSKDDFEFMDLDYEIKPEVWASIRNGEKQISWHSINQILPLFAKAGSVLSKQVESYSMNASNNAPIGMADLAIQLQGYDVLSTVLDVNDAIRSSGFNELIHSGLIRLNQMIIIDAFGNTIQFDSQNKTPQIAMSLESSDDSEFAILRPRSIEPMRVLLSLADGCDDGDDPERAGYTVSPVSAFILPDHIEWAMEVFDPQGKASGQLRVAERDIRLGGFQTGRLLWDPAPGVETQLGASPDIGNSHANSMLQQLVEISIQDEVKLQQAKREHPESLEMWPEGVLSSLMRAIDTTLWDTDPLGKSPEDLPSLYSGRPLALVRAELEIELNPEDPNYANPEDIIEVKLGDMERLIDGLLGYFLDNDYSRFYSVLTDHVIQLPENNIQHEYLRTDSTIDLRFDQKRQLTLLMDPQSDVHVTTGMLPQKEIGLMREHKQQQLAQIAPTYRAGPMLVDPSTVRMPVPDLILPTEWSWMTKKNSNQWDEDPIVPEDGKPHMPSGRIKAWNGWLKLNKKNE